MAKKAGKEEDECCSHHCQMVVMRPVQIKYRASGAPGFLIDVNDGMLLVVCFCDYKIQMLFVF